MPEPPDAVTVIEAVVSDAPVPVLVTEVDDADAARAAEVFVAVIGTSTVYVELIVQR